MQNLSKFLRNILKIKISWTLNVEKLRTMILNMAQLNKQFIKKKKNPLEWSSKSEHEEVLLFHKICTNKNFLNHVNLVSSIIIAKNKLTKLLIIIIMYL